MGTRLHNRRGRGLVGYPEWPLKGHLAGEGEDWGKQLQGSGGSQARFIRTQKGHPRRMKPNTRRWQETTIHTGREIGGDTTETGGPTADEPQGTDRDLGTCQGRQGGENGRGIWQRNQARSAGRRDERRRLAGGWWGKSPGGRWYTPVEDVGSGWEGAVKQRWKLLIGRQ